MSKVNKEKQKTSLENEESHNIWSDFHTTTVIALIVAAFDVGTFLIVQDLTTKVVLIGIFTFFGMLIVSAYHERAKTKSSEKESSKHMVIPPGSSFNSSTSDVPDASDTASKLGKWDGEIMRTSIAGTLILVYVIVLVYVIFNHDLSDNALLEKTVDNFGNVIIVVVGFYFGSKGAIQIYSLYKDKQTPAKPTPDT